nr:hypothetical protein [uncultured Halomonas sp.]
MRVFTVRFDDRETLPDRLEKLAAEREITPEQLIKRLIVEGIAEIDGETGACVPGESLEDFLVKNGVWKPTGAE